MTGRVEQNMLQFTRTEVVHVFQTDSYHIEMYRNVSVRVVYTPDITWSQNCPGCDALHLWEGGAGKVFTLKNCKRHGKASIDAYRCICGAEVIPPFKVVEDTINGPTLAKGWVAWSGTKPKRDVIIMESYDLPVKGRARVLAISTARSCMVIQFQSETD